MTNAAPAKNKDKKDIVNACLLNRGIFADVKLFTFWSIAHCFGYRRTHVSYELTPGS